MKKMIKIKRTLNALAMALDESMKLHPMYTKEYCDNSSTPCSDCDDYNKCCISKFMVSFLDAEHNLLVRNWLGNSWTDYCPAKTKLINEMADNLDIDIQHLMWEQADSLLPKVRYIRIGNINNIYTEDEYLFVVEKGTEYDVYYSYNKLGYAPYQERRYFFDDEEEYFS